jgi:VWFA-related protein
MNVRLSALLVAVVFTTSNAQELPRFRAGANLVSVDAYFSKDGTAVTDLRADEIEILEDGRPQAIESFRLVRASKAGAVATRPDPQGAAAEREAAQQPDARVFVVFFDQWHVSFEGSSKASAPISALLQRVVGADDLVGSMTPEMPARSLSLTRRIDGLDRVVRDITTWNQRDRVNSIDPREQEIALCYPDADILKPRYRGVAKELIERRREQKTLQALDDLVTHLGNLRDERKFVVLLSEGWVLFRHNERLGAVVEPDSVLRPPTIGTDDGRVTTSGDAGAARGYDRTFESCERERAMLAFVDHSLEVRELAQRANRANVTFYVVDPRGVAVFDDPIGPMRPATPLADRDRLASRHGGLRELAQSTDGAVVLDTSNVKEATARMMADLNAYYLMRYYSSNTKLDGRYRQITLRVKRPGVQVRARQGYLAPTQAEVRAASTVQPESPIAVERALRKLPMEALRRGPSTGLAYVRAMQPQFRRTERLRVEIALPEGAVSVSGRVLTSLRQPLPLVVTVTNALTAGNNVTLADVALAPLAVGSYTLEVAFEVNGEKAMTIYDFKIVP